MRPVQLLSNLPGRPGRVFRILRAHRRLRTTELCNLAPLRHDAGWKRSIQERSPSRQAFAKHEAKSPRPQKRKNQHKRVSEWSGGAGLAFRHKTK